MLSECGEQEIVTFKCNRSVYMNRTRLFNRLIDALDSCRCSKSVKKLNQTAFKQLPELLCIQVANNKCPRYVSSNCGSLFVLNTLMEPL